MSRADARLAGHSLPHEGIPTRLSDGTVVGPYGYAATRTACSCGALSPDGLSVYATRRWHREIHKPEVRAGAAAEAST